MIYFVDDFLDKESYDLISKQVEDSEFEEVVVGDKSFWIVPSNGMMDIAVASRLEAIEGRPIRNILSFFRMSSETCDTDWRIHSDQKINGEQPDRAVVLFVSENHSDIELTGTAFWEHEEYGHVMPRVSNEEFDRMLKEEANDTCRWKLNTVIGHRENRLISYPSSYFHSKYPNKSWKERRMIFVMFYSYGQE